MDVTWLRRRRNLLKFAGTIYNHKILPGNIFGLILKNKMATMGVSLSVIKSSYIMEIMGWESFDVVRFDLGPLLQGQTRIAKFKTAYNSLIIGPRCLGW